MSEQSEVIPITDEEIAEHLRNLKNPVYVDDLASNGGVDLYTEARFIARIRAEAVRAKVSAMSEARALAINEDLRERIKALEDNRALWVGAFGLVSTVVPSMEIDIENPTGMAQRIRAEVSALRAEIERLKGEKR